MLVLCRKVGEQVRIGHDVRITVVKLDRNTVRIGIEAPDGLTIVRQELIAAEAQAEPLALEREVALCAS